MRGEVSPEGRVAKSTSGTKVDRPPTLRHGVSLWYDDGSVSIAERDEQFVVVHTENARWFRTDKAGAASVKRFAECIGGEEMEYTCHRAEAEFLEKVLASRLFERGADANHTIPAVVCLSITERCNLECSYCFYSASHANNKNALHVKELRQEELAKLFGQVHQLNPYARIYLTGGEPFANKNIIKYFQMIKDARLYAGVVTNGVMLTERRLALMEDVGVDEIRISVDGVTKEVHEATRPGTFDKVYDALRRLEKRNFRVVLSMTVTSENQHEARHLASFAKDCGFVVSFSHMVPTGRGAENQGLLPDYEALVRDMAHIQESEGFVFLEREGAQGWRRHTCGLAGQSLYVDLNGNVSPCNMLSKTGHNLGNVFNSDLSEVIQSKAASEVRAGVDQVAYCRNCHVRYICGGPCRASSLFAVGNLQSRGPDCSFKYAEVIDSLFSGAEFIPGPVDA